MVVVTSATSRGRNVRPEGLDFRAGDVLLPRGHRFTSRSLALVAAMNHPTVPVHRRPKVALLATGDELVAPGSTTGPGQIVYSNGFALGALIRNEGAELLDLGIVGDHLDATVAAISRARRWGADVAGHDRRRVGRRLRPGATGPDLARPRPRVLEGGAAAGEAAAARPDRRHARAGRSGQSGVRASSALSCFSCR